MKKGTGFLMILCFFSQNRITMKIYNVLSGKGWSKWVVLPFYLFTFSPLLADDVRVSSPDGNLVVTVNIRNGVPSYSATLFNKPVIEQSALGLKTSVGNFTCSLQLLDHKTEAVHNKYQMRGTKASGNDYQANRLTLNFRDRDGLGFGIIFQVSNNDIAFRYAIPRQKYSGKEFKRALIYHEASAFNFPQGTTTFLSPQIGPETGWEQTKPSYEEEYSADAPMTAKSRYDHGYIFPALFHLPNSSNSTNSTNSTNSQALWVLVGETGVGKSTLIRLMLSLLKPTSGTVSLYNSSESMQASPLTRCNIVYVPQGNTLFSGTIRHNLMIGDPEADEEKMLWALKAAQADFVFDLPDGLDTVCGERGSGLSEGQSQRIAIARGLLRPGNILLFDEFSSSLDPETEDRLIKNITELASDKTMIFITHRERIAEFCDRELKL